MIADAAETSRLDRELYDAAERGEIELVRKLLLLGASPNFVLPFWNHPILHRAVFTRHHAIVELLLTSGAMIENKSSDRSTALHLACDQNDPISVQILLRHGANDNALTIRNLSPLDIATENKCIAVQRMLKCYRLTFQPKKQFFQQLPKGTQMRMKIVVLCHHRLRRSVMTASHDDNGVWLRDVVFGDLQYHVLWDILSFMWEMERDMPVMGWQLENEI